MKGAFVRSVVVATGLATILTPAALAGNTTRDVGENATGVSVQQHGGVNDHLPPARENIDVVGKLKLDGQPFGNILPGQIADVAVYKNSAYLMSWSPADPGETVCTRGGFFAVDISNPGAPRQRGFVPALPETYHGEGAHAITVNTPAFQGDILAVNNEPCGPDGVGGFDLYDVTNPDDPKPLVMGAGDQSPDDDSLAQDPAEVPNSAHSIFIWQDGPRAYAVIVDNTELHDVDVFDITDPRNPELIADIDLAEKFPAIVPPSANGNTVFLHDMIVKRIGGKPVMLASYWDAGYIQLDVSDPANPTLMTETDFPGVEPLVDLDPLGAAEGNAHQAEFSHDNQFILAADEDFATFRPTFQITDGPNVGEYGSGEFGFSKPIKTLSDSKLNGPTIYGGYGCTADNKIPPASSLPALEPGEEKIVVVQRGPVGDPAAPYDACRFDEKMSNAIAKGYDGIIIGSRHAGSAAADGAFCGSGDPRPIAGMCVTHEALHRIFNTPPDHSSDYSGGTEPAVGAIGARVSAVSRFDGWGYAHLYDAQSGQKLDDYAIPEGVDERYASGFGDLSIHEWATDPTENLAYSAYYAGGIRVAKFGRSTGIEEVGKFIEQGGSNFWGVEQFTGPDGSRLIAGSDRDYGLYILRYTGPGAAVPPACAGIGVTTTVGQAVSVPLSCTDANGNALTMSIAGAPANGTLSAISGGAVTYTPNAGFTGTDTFTYLANDGVANSAPAIASVVVSNPPPVGGTGPVVSTKIRIVVGKLKGRTMRIVVFASANGMVQARFRLAGKTLASKTVKVVKGTNRFQLTLSPKSMRAFRQAVKRGLKGTVVTTFEPTVGPAVVARATAR